MITVFSALLASSLMAAEVPTGNTGHAQNPQWSADGSWLAFEMNNLSNAIDLWLVSIENGQPGTPSQLKVPGSSGFGGGGFAAAPTWTWRGWLG